MHGAWSFAFALPLAGSGDPVENNLGSIAGRRGSTDPAAAAAPFTKAAKPGSAKAAFDLGTLLERDGVAASPGTAATWYRQAAERGCAPAMCSLGLSHARGLGVPQDFVAAVELFRRAAEQGDANGQYLLAIGYRHGTGVVQDPVLALQWFALAAAHGHAAAGKQRDEVAAGMSRADVDKALQLARRWRPSTSP